MRPKTLADQKKALTMRQVFSVTKTKFFPTMRQWSQLPALLSTREKKTLGFAGSIFTLSLLALIGTYIFTHRVEVPAIGGEYTEGLVGEPQFVNPLYASSNDVDQDLASLIYSGLLRWDPKLGLVPDLAESMEVSEDGLTYTFKIRDNARFHNGEKVLARDVLFTITSIQNPSYRSPLIDDFRRARVAQVDDQTVSFTLEEPFAPFLSSLTVGILPSMLWAEILPQNAPLTALNLQPIGSGPYQFAEFAKDKRGSVRSFTLSRNGNFYDAAPFIETLMFKFYPDADALADALSNKNVEGAGVVAFAHRENVARNGNVAMPEPLFPQETVLLFNQAAHAALTDLDVRSAIAGAINKPAIVNEALQGRARVLYGPFVEGMAGFDPAFSTPFDPSAGNAVLDEAGYDRATNGMRQMKNTQDDATTEPSPLAFTLTAADTPEMRLVAARLQQDLFGLGIELILDFVPPETMPQEVIEPRNFELLLTSFILEGDPDPYPFWHSSQAKAGGLNLVGYNNKEVDTMIVAARKEKDESVRAKTYQQIAQQLAKDAPAVFLYQSRYAFAVSQKVHFTAPERILIPSDRFANIETWYIKTKKALR